MEISSVSNLSAQAGVPAETRTPPASSVERQALIRAAHRVNEAGLLGQDQELTFVIDRQSRRAVARIVDRNTREVIQQIPAEYVIRIAEEYSGR